MLEPRNPPQVVALNDPLELVIDPDGGAAQDRLPAIWLRRREVGRTYDVFLGFGLNAVNDLVDQLQEKLGEELFGYRVARRIAEGNREVGRFFVQVDRTGAQLLDEANLVRPDCSPIEDGDEVEVELLDFDDADPDVGIQNAFALGRLLPASAVQLGAGYPSTDQWRVMLLDSGEVHLHEHVTDGYRTIGQIGTHGYAMSTLKKGVR